jgi:hypothetical protein
MKSLESNNKKEESVYSTEEIEQINKKREVIAKKFAGFIVEIENKYKGFDLCFSYGHLDEKGNFVFTDTRNYDEKGNPQLVGVPIPKDLLLNDKEYQIKNVGYEPMNLGSHEGKNKIELIREIKGDPGAQFNFICSFKRIESDYVPGPDVEWNTKFYFNISDKVEFIASTI